MNGCLLAGLCLLLSGGVLAQNPAVGQPSQTGSSPGLTREQFEFVLRDGTRVPAERAFFRVPENRSKAHSRGIELHFIRFPSTGDKPGSPIIFLAGGPGGSGISAAPGLFPLFSALREFGDVIALDQRGTGKSNSFPQCVTHRRLPVEEPFVFAEFTSLMRQAAADCAAFWQKEGVDLAGYTSVESARDIDDLRRALGAQKVSLLGISYGSRLAITALREMPGRIDRAILAAVEPTHATIKLPSSLDAHIARLQAAINTDPTAAAAYPDIAALLRRVHAKLDAKPLQLTAVDEDGSNVSFLFGGDEMRMLAAGGFTDPGSAAQVVPSYAAIDAGAPLSANLTRRMLRLRRRLDPIVFDAMAATDYTAGISRRRLALVHKQIKGSIFGNYQTWEQDARVALGLDDLGEDYRAPVRTDVPTLVLTGTLDGLHDPADTAHALKRFSRLSQVTVLNGGHNILMQDPAIGEVMTNFLRGREVPRTITVSPPAFKP